MWQNQVYDIYFDKDGGITFIYVARVATGIFDVVFLMYPSVSFSIPEGPFSSFQPFLFSVFSDEKPKVKMISREM